jgi:hypothetical protein
MQRRIKKAIITLAGIATLSITSSSVAQVATRPGDHPAGILSGVWAQPLTIIDHVVLSMRSQLADDAADIQSWRDTTLWTFTSPNRARFGISVEPRAYILPGSADLVIGLHVDADRLVATPRTICRDLIHLFVASVAGEDERVDIRHNLLSHFMPPTFFATTTPAQQNADYDELQRHIVLRVTLLEGGVTPARYTTCERRAQTDSMTVVTEPVHP